MTCPEIDSLNNTAKKLSNCIAADEYNAREMIRHASSLKGKAQCIKEFQQFLESINETSETGQRRAILLDELQRENKLIMAYQEENRVLKDAVEDCFNTLNRIMEKHKVVSEKVQKTRNASMTLDDIWNLIFMINDNSGKENLRGFNCQLLNLVSQEEHRCFAYTEKLTQLRHEHSVLKEMLRNSEISNPGVQKIFSNILTEVKRKRVCNESSEDEELDDTIIEVSPVLNNTVIEVSRSCATDSSTIS
ncbi:unnamed protein product [Auanema sp. JU1783]|nr:unnamed protein product [Auanema sp. JU1783]